MEEIIAELRALRVEVGELRERIGCSVGKVICKGVTGNGTMCRNGALPGGEYCRMHGREKKVREPKKETKKKEPKKKKIQPEHNHEIGEEPTHPCELCESHGDVMDPKLPDDDFECICEDDIESRLRKILEEENENVQE
jgi:hypothetical protein